MGAYELLPTIARRYKKVSVDNISEEISKITSSKKAKPQMPKVILKI